MSTTIERATFYEGQILGAEDLRTSADYPRNQLARHERCLHTWGITSGFKLNRKELKTDKDEKYLEVSFDSGTAIDVTGREIVVPDTVTLVPGEFRSQNIAIQPTTKDEEIWYPVFLSGRDQAQQSQSLGATKCGSSLPTRAADTYSIKFGFPNEAGDWQNQTAPDVAAGPGTAGDARILLGFVQWNAAINQFVKADYVNATNTGRKYAGVLADEVAARSGEVTIRTTPVVESGKPAMVIDQTEGGELRFGFQDVRGGISDPIFRVTAKGDIKVKGDIDAKGAVTANTVKPLITTGVLIESGVAHDGMILPLPVGITEEQVASGKAKLHIQVTPLYLGVGPKPNFIGLCFPIECKVVGRRVSCRNFWVGIGPTFITALPGTCNYTVMAYVAAEGS